MKAANSKTVSIVFNTTNQDLIDEIRDAIANSELGDIRSILDEHYKQPTLIDNLVIVNHLEFHLDVKFVWCPVDGWSYEE